MPPPLVSVIMPVYNAERYLPGAVDSILNQAYSDFELIILNDGSTDGTREMLATYHDPRICLLDNQSNLGLTRSLQKGINHARGEYIARMDADDISLPQRLERQVTFLEQHYEVGFLGSAVQTVDQVGQPLETWSFPETHGLIKWALCFYSPFVHPVMMMRREIFSVTNYDQSLNYAQDYDLWTRLIWHTRAANLPDVLLKLRKHPQNVSAFHSDEQVENSIRISQKMIERALEFPLSLQVVSALKGLAGAEPGELRAAAGVINGLARGFQTDESLTPEEFEWIKRDAIHREIVLARSAWPHPGFLKIVARMFTLDKFLAGKILTQGVRRALMKPLTGRDT